MTASTGTSARGQAGVVGPLALQVGVEFFFERIRDSSLLFGPRLLKKVTSALYSVAEGRHWK